MNQVFGAGAKLLSPLDGTERVKVDNGGSVLVETTTADIAALAELVSSSDGITTLATVGAGTLTAAAITGGIISRTGAQATAAFIDTTATAAAIIAALPDGAPVGTTFSVTIANQTDGEETIAAGVGVTLVGNVVIPKLTWTQFLAKMLTATTVSLTSVVSGRVVELPISQTATTDGVSTTQVGGICGSEICNLQITGTVAPRTVYLPRATEIFAAIPNAKVGMTYLLNVLSLVTTTGITTLGASAGVTISGLATLTGVNSSCSYNVSIDSATAVTLTRAA